MPWTTHTYTETTSAHVLMTFAILVPVWCSVYLLYGWLFRVRPTAHYNYAPVRQPTTLAGKQQPPQGGTFDGPSSDSYHDDEDNLEYDDDETPGEPVVPAAADP